MGERIASDAAVLEAAIGVLRGNDTGTLVTAAPRLYPHQWSWDAAFVSVGLAHLSVPRAILEWRTIFGAQWSTGMLPHIVFADQPDYFPGYGVWGTESVPARPRGVQTSGICQPPVHALCVELLAGIGAEHGGTDAAAVGAFVADAVPRLAAWHDWLWRARDPEGLGVIEIHHGWESGMDNSPRFDPFYDRIVVAHPKDLPRTDLKHADAAERPSDREYQRYIWLIDQMRSVNYDDDLLPGVMDFRCGDIFLTAALALSSASLARLADSVGAGELAARERARASGAGAAVAASIDPATGLCRDYDCTLGRWVDVATIAGFSLLLCGGEPDAVARQTALLQGETWAGNPALRYPLPPSVSPDAPGFAPRAYWRGPVWPIMNWLLSETARGRGDAALAARLRAAGLDQLRDLAFGEYYEPVTGEQLGSRRQSWTAMAAIDWLSGRWG
jgi:glucosylglycerate hydrolase